MTNEETPTTEAEAIEWIDDIFCNIGLNPAEGLSQDNRDRITAVLGARYPVRPYRQIYGDPNERINK